MIGWYRPVRRSLYLDFRPKHLLDSALKINAITKAANQKDKLDLFCSLLYLILNEIENLADDRLEDALDLGPCELKAMFFDIRSSPKSGHWDINSLLTVEFIFRYPFKMLHSGLQEE